MRSDINFTEGSILKPVFRYTIPLVLSGMLQVFFNAADLAVVGQYAGSAATAAVGATGSVIALILNVAMGLSVGVNVALSRSLGAKDSGGAHRTVHTAVGVSLLSGIVIGIFGFLVARPVMLLTNCPDASLDMAIEYMQIYFIGCPGVMLYNFGSAILRTQGDTKRPLYFLTVSGILNVILNYIFVCYFGMKAGGVALATAISQYVAAVMTIISLTRQEGECRFAWKSLRFYRKELADIIKYGLPSGITNSLYGIANVQIQSALNTFGDSVVAGSSAVASLESFLNAASGAFNAAAVTFTGQNIGAGKKKRVQRSFLVCLGSATGFSLIAGMAMYLGGEWLITTVYVPNDTVAVDAGMIRAAYMLTLNWMIFAKDVAGGVVQAMGHSVPIMVVSLLGGCGFRTVWMQWIYPMIPTMDTIFACYPITWAIIMIANFAVYGYGIRKYRQADSES